MRECLRQKQQVDQAVQLAAVPPVMVLLDQAVAVVAEVLGQ
jgi:hypothetical protein